MWWYRYELPDIHNTYAHAQCMCTQHYLSDYVQSLLPAVCLLLHLLYPKMMVGRDCRKLTEREVAEYVGILKN